MGIVRSRSSSPGWDTHWNRGKDFQLLTNGWRPRESEVSLEEYDPGLHEISELVKRSPGDGRLALYRYAEFGSALYALRCADRPDRLLDGVVWADFDRHGRLFVATAGGEIKLLDPAKAAGETGGAVETVVTHGLNSLRPEPVEAPAWAKKW